MQEKWKAIQAFLIEKMAGLGDCDPVKWTAGLGEWCAEWRRGRVGITIRLHSPTRHWSYISLIAEDIGGLFTQAEIDELYLTLGLETIHLQKRVAELEKSVSDSTPPTWKPMDESLKFLPFEHMLVRVVKTGEIIHCEYWSASFFANKKESFVSRRPDPFTEKRNGFNRSEIDLILQAGFPPVPKKPTAKTNPADESLSKHPQS